MARVPSFPIGLIVGTHLTSNNNKYRIDGLHKSTHDELIYKATNIRTNNECLISEDNVVKTFGQGFYLATTSYLSVDMDLDTPELEGPFTPKEVVEALEETYDEENTQTYTIFVIEHGEPRALKAGYVSYDYEITVTVEDVEKLFEKAYTA